MSGELPAADQWHRSAGGATIRPRACDARFEKLAVPERGPDQLRGDSAKRDLRAPVPAGALLTSLPTRVDVDEPLVWWSLSRRAEEIGMSSARCPKTQGELKLNVLSRYARRRDQIRATLLQAKLNSRRWLTDRYAESHLDRLGFRGALVHTSSRLTG